MYQAVTRGTPFSRNHLDQPRLPYHGLCERGRYALSSSFLGRPRGRFCNTRPVSCSSFPMNFCEPHGSPLSALRRRISSSPGSRRLPRCVMWCGTWANTGQA